MLMATVFALLFGAGFSHTARSRRMHQNVRAALDAARVPRKALGMDKGRLSRALTCADDTQLSLSQMALWPCEFWQWFVRIVGLEVGLVTFDAEDVLAQVKPRMLKADLVDERKAKVTA